MRNFRSRFTKSYGNYFKIYSMPLWKLMFLDAFLSVMAFATRLSRNIQKLPHIIITPRGIHVDQRQSPRYHFIPERRVVDYLIDYFSHLFRTEP